MDVEEEKIKILRQKEKPTITSKNYRGKNGGGREREDKWGIERKREIQLVSVWEKEREGERANGKGTKNTQEYQVMFLQGDKNSGCF